MSLGCFGQEKKELNHLPSICPSATGLSVASEGHNDFPPQSPGRAGLPPRIRRPRFPPWGPRPAHRSMNRKRAGRSAPALGMRGSRRAQAQKPQEAPIPVPPSRLPLPSPCALGYGCRWPFLHPQGAGGRWGQGPGCREGVVLSLTAALPALRHSPPGVFSPGLLPEGLLPGVLVPGSLLSGRVSSPGFSSREFFSPGFPPRGSPPGGLSSPRVSPPRGLVSVPPPAKPRLALPGPQRGPSLPGAAVGCTAPEQPPTLGTESWGGVCGPGPSCGPQWLLSPGLFFGRWTFTVTRPTRLSIVRAKCGGLCKSM